jgi:putative protease
MHGEVSEMGDKKLVGIVTRYFAKIGVAAIMLEDTLKVGNRISVEGTTTNFEQSVASMQVDRAEIEAGEAGQEIAIKVSDRVREKDKVYLLD